MPVKKKPSPGKKKKEVLPDPQTLPAGKCNYYIAPWSRCRSFDGISNIARVLLEQNTDADGVVGSIPRANILIPAGTLGRGDDRYQVEVADNMYIESVPQSVIKSAMLAGKKEDTGGEEEDPLREQSPYDTEAKVPDDGKENADGAPPSVGASTKAAEVNIRGAVDIVGVLTRIVVKPDLPEQPVLKVPKKGAKRKKSKAVEEEQRFAEEMKIYEEEVEKLVSEAKAQENHLMQFAHPDRWPSVTFVNLTFTSPVNISHAHVKFRDCCFNSRFPQTAQLLVSQYCKVECDRCTFDRPIKCGVYGWPHGEVTLRKCLFTGVTVGSHGDTARFERPNAVGLHADECKVHVEECLFTELGTGILLRGGKESNDTHLQKGAAAAVVRGCRIERIFGVGVVVEDVSGVEVAQNKISDCRYYALDCVKGTGIRVVRNEFLSKVRINDDAQAKLLGNDIGTVPLPPKDADNPNWQPVY